MAARLLHWLFFGLTLMQVLFFAGAGVLPLQTVGLPALNRPLLRVQMWEASGQPMLFGMTIVVAVMCLWLGPRPKPYQSAALVVVLLFAAHGLLLAETAILVKGGELALPIKRADLFVLGTRIATFVLAALATSLVARIAVRQLVRVA